MEEVIDPHLHLFDLQKGHYAWLQQEQPPNWPDKQKIAKSFTEADLVIDAPYQLSGFVHIEAGFDNQQPWRELEWLESHCTLPFKSIAFLDLTSADAEDDLLKLQAYPSLKGIRYILDDAASELLQQPQFQANLELLQAQGLVFEAQYTIVDSQATEAMSAVLSRFPDLLTVINHAGFPTELSEEWKSAIMTLAHHENCYIKCSGWEMTDRAWDAEKVTPLINYAIREFGLTRVMLASNFPVSELSCGYSQLWQRLLQQIKWKGFERRLLIADNAKRVYGF